jgi:putrescine aminotransferase
MRSTQQWQGLDRQHHLHPFTDPKTLAARGTRVIERAEGVYVWDSDGNKILDGMAGLWCVAVGYGRRELVDAATRQMQTLPYYNSFFQSSTPTQIELAKTLAELTPAGLKYFFFANSGSEANDTIIRLARHYWALQGKPRRRIFIGRTYGYHGSTLAASSLGGMPAMHVLDKQVLPEFAHIPHPDWYTMGGELSREEYGIKAARELETKILELGAENVAAFIGEPVQGAGGGFDPPSTYWPEIQRICRKYQVLLVADEVICGFGRTGNWFGSQTYRIQPDFMPMAKGLSSGYQPIAAVAIHERIYDVIHEGGQIHHGYTYSGHPVACAVALANIELMKKEQLVERVRDDVGPYFRACLQQLADAHPIVGELRGSGLLAALQLVKDRATRTFFAVEEEAAPRCRDFALENNLIMRPTGRQTMVLCPPLVITRSEIDELVDKAKRSLDRTAALFGLA